MEDVYLSVPINRKFILATSWGAIAYIILNVFLLCKGITGFKLTSLTWKTIGLLNSLLLVFLFIFVVEVLRRTKDKRYVIAGYCLYPALTLFTMCVLTIFPVPILSPVMVTLGALGVLVDINLFIQGLRLKKSPIRIYLRMIAIIIFVILLFQQLFPLLIAARFHYDKLLYMKLHSFAALFSFTLYILIPINVFLIIRKLKSVQ